MVIIMQELFCVAEKSITAETSVCDDGERREIACKNRGIIQEHNYQIVSKSVLLHTA